MEFTRELMVMEEVMSDICRREGDVSKQSQCNEKKASSVIKLIQEKISTNKLEDNEECMRKIHFYILLKCDFKVSDLLEDDLDVGHIASPTICCQLFVKIAWELHLENYFCESVVYCPPVLGDELLETATKWILLHLKDKNVRNIAKKLSESVYLKMLRVERNTENIEEQHCSVILCKLHGHFLKITAYVKGSGKETDVVMLPDFDLATSLITILRLMKSCFTLYFGDGWSFTHRLYQMTLPYDYASEWPPASSDNSTVEDCNLRLVDMAVDLFEGLSVDTWCTLSELNSGADGKSFQKLIGEEIYTCLPLLKDLQLSKKCTGPKVDMLVSMLNTMAVKPWDEDDDIRAASIEEIVKTVSDESKTQSKWLRALLGSDNDVLSNATCLECLERHVSLVELKDVAVVLQNVLHTLGKGGGNGSDYEERLKQVAFNSVRQFSVQQQLQIMKSFFEEYKINKTLYTANFTAVLTELFNKAVCIEGGETEKFLADCIILCFQSPRELLLRILSEGLSNAYLTRLMIETLCELRFVAYLKTVDERGNVANTCLMAELITELMDRAVLSEQEQDHFPCLIKLLIDNSIVAESVFLEECLFPTISKSVETKDWSLLYLWLQTLSEVKTWKEGEYDVGPILIILAKVLEASRNDMRSFTNQAAAVSEQSIKMIQVALREVRTGSCDEWLRSTLTQAHLSPINEAYFGELLGTGGLDASPDREWDMILFSVIRDVDVSAGSLEMLRNTEESDIRTHLWSSLLKVFPILTANEWRNLPGVQKLFPELGDASRLVLLLDLLTDSLLFLFLYTEMELLEDASVLSCFKFSVQNFGAILQEELLPNIQFLSSEDLKSVFARIVFVVEKSPTAIRELWSLLLVPTLTKIMSAAVDTASREPKADIVPLAKEICCAISTSSVRDVRVALAVQLAQLIPRLAIQ